MSNTDICHKSASIPVGRTGHRGKFISDSQRRHAPQLIGVSDDWCRTLGPGVNPAPPATELFTVTTVTEAAGLTRLRQVERYFSDPALCLEWMVKGRWPNGVTCPRCSSATVAFVANEHRWECYAQHENGSPQKFSVKVGTIFEDSPFGLDRWLVAIWLLGNSKRGIRSYEIARDLMVTQKTAWFMLQRIRKAMRRGQLGETGGPVPRAVPEASMLTECPPIASPMERFENMLKQIVSVPKAEINRQQKQNGSIEDEG